MPAAAETAASSPATGRPVPAAFLMRFEVDLPRLGDGALSPPFDLPDAAALPTFADLDGQPRFAAVAVGWTPAGLAVRVVADGKTKAPRANAKAPGEGDGLHLWIDTRPTGTAHRAGRYCRRFALLPSTGRMKKPGVYEVPITQGGPATLAEALPVPVSAAVRADGYDLDAFLPAAHLPGFEPERSGVIALHTLVSDAELGEQPLTVGAAFPTAHDPSTWTRAALAG